LFAVKKYGYLLLICAPLLFIAHRAQAWGFFGHCLLNRLAVYTLPPGMIGFYKANIDYLTVNATRPDSRRTVVPDEAPKHFLDVDRYGDSAEYKLPRKYADSRPIEGGKTALMLLCDQLDLLGYKMDQVFDAVCRADAAALVAHGAFLAEKFGTGGGLDLGQSGSTPGPAAPSDGRLQPPGAS
jgi:hypothetical protein